MALGRCMTCDKLVPIFPKHATSGFHKLDWYPHHHDDNGGKLCNGHKRKII